MIEQIIYNITMVILLICWLVASYFGVTYDGKYRENILMVRQISFQTMCLLALINHDLFLE